MQQQAGEPFTGPIQMPPFGWFLALQAALQSGNLSHGPRQITGILSAPAGHATVNPQFKKIQIS